MKSKSFYICHSFGMFSIVKTIALITVASCFSYGVLAVFPEIQGGSQFQRQVREALQLLQWYAPDKLDFINSYVKRIQEYSKSGMCSWCNPPTYQLANVPGNMEKYWLASTIAHDSFHSYLYHYNKALYRGEPPVDTHSGVNAEKKCNAFQLQTLRQINAPKQIIDHMLKQDGTHCDLNGDGKCDDKDYQIRNYR